jgi:hypothetical protein
MDCLLTKLWLGRRLEKEDGELILGPLHLHRVNILERDEETRTRTVLYETMNSNRIAVMRVTHRSMVFLAPAPGPFLLPNLQPTSSQLTTCLLFLPQLTYNQ